ncbi:S24 family peptidase [Flavobacterium suncheonense]|uniref:S24 family peptidase n=1 Tax=Flavobacterium suncheonense TaxID=350894 RepID=UPI000403D292|nr:S24 family peptidase [Flavobacterium suncheonense]
MNDITIRFLEVYEYLKTAKIIHTPKGFANEIGVSTSLITEICKKRTNAGLTPIQNLISRFEFINPEWLLTGTGEMIKSDSKIEDEILKNEPEKSFIQESKTIIPLIPIEAMAGIGNGSVQILEKDIIDGYVIPEFTQRGVEYIIRVSGSSMYPKYSSGDLLGCRTVTDTSFFQWGKIYVLDTDQGPMVKRLFPIADNVDYLECRSDNKEYPPFPISKSSIYKIAIVVGVLRLE